MDLSFLPAVNAGLNGLATCLLLAGWVCIKNGLVAVHRRCMLSATAVSGLFLICYVSHRVWKAGQGGGSLHTAYLGPGKAVYTAVLISHVVLAMTVPVLAVWLIALGLRGHVDRHRRVARVALPIWLYVSVTGVLIYVVLYGV